MFGRLRRRFATKRETTELLPGERLCLSGKPLWIRDPGQPLRVEMGQQLLDLYPDPRIAVEEAGDRAGWLLRDPARDFTHIGHTMRLAVGARFSIDADSAGQRVLFTQPDVAFRRRLRIVHEQGCLSFRDSAPDPASYVSLLENPLDIRSLREQALFWLRQIYGGPLQPLDRDPALALLRNVNTQLATSAWRRQDGDGEPGGLVELPPELVPVIVGDLHANIDNLLTVLSENSFLESLRDRSAVLILLGDLVHPDQPGQLQSMTGSTLIMDLLFTLMLALPGRVVCLLGNHDTFSPEVMKGGVAQGVLWRRHLLDCRGPAYVEEMTRFYRLLPLVALSDDYLVCHAGPLRGQVSRELLVDVRRHPALVHDLIWTRLRTASMPAGYNRADVRRFRASLGLAPKTPFVVGHTVLSDNKTLWTDIGGIPEHHLVYSSAASEVGVFTRVGGQMVAQIYPSEPLLEWVNRHACGC